MNAVNVLLAALKGLLSTWKASDWTLLVAALLSATLGRWFSADQTNQLAALLVQLFLTAGPVVLLVVKVVEHRGTEAPPAPPPAGAPALKIHDPAA